MTDLYLWNQKSDDKIVYRKRLVDQFSFLVYPVKLLRFVWYCIGGIYASKPGWHQKDSLYVEKKKNYGNLILVIFNVGLHKI